MRRSQYHKGEYWGKSRRAEPTRPPPVSMNNFAHSREKILLWLRYIKNDPWWKSQMPVTDAALAKIIGMTKSNFSESMNHVRGHSDRVICKKIGLLIPDIEARKICFPEIIQFGDKGTSTPKFLWLDPPDQAPRICQLSLETAWSLWACCASCGDNKFLSVMLNDSPYVACYKCLPPNQYPAVRATAVKKSLIHAALKKYY